MNFTLLLEQLFNLVVFPVITLGGIYLIYLMNVKIKEIKQKTNNEVANKYLDMLDDTIANAVLATTQTYVDSLKSAGKFDLEAQKEAFKKTYDAVMKVLTDEATTYIVTAVGDLETYITNKIEAQVKVSKTL